MGLRIASVATWGRVFLAVTIYPCYAPDYNSVGQVGYTRGDRDVISPNPKPRAQGVAPIRV